MMAKEDVQVIEQTVEDNHSAPLDASESTA